MKNRILSIIGVAIFSMVMLLSVSNNVNRNRAVDDSLKAISIGISAQAESGSNHGRPLLSNGSSYKCDSCTGTDCGAAC